MEVRSQLHAMANSLVLTEQEAGWTPEPVCMSWRGYKSLAPTAI